MAAKKRVARCSRGVSASDLAQMGVCERLVKFEHQCGRRRTSDQLQTMDRGRRAHERFYLDRHDDGRLRGRCFVATLGVRRGPRAPRAETVQGSGHAASATGAPLDRPVLPVRAYGVRVSGASTELTADRALDAVWVRLVCGPMAPV